MMKLRYAVLASVVAMSSTASYAADYLPTGVQTNVATSTVTGGGWNQCFSQAYGTFGPLVASILSGCNASAPGARLMLAARATGSSTLLLLAQAAASDVTTVTSGDATTSANGVEWYFSDSRSMGFAPGGASVSLNSCDTVDSSFNNPGGPSASQRLCWHTGNGEMNGGWRAGQFDSLNDSTAYEKVIYNYVGSSGAVPEPASWALMIGGFGLAGAAMRRRKVAVAYG